MFISEFPEDGAKLYGPPGTGKTWTMIELFKMAIEQGYSPYRMMMITYRKPMALGMASRLAESVELPADLKLKDIAKTIHSVCWYHHFRALKEQDPNISKIDYMTHVDWLKFSTESGYKMLPGDEDDYTQASPLHAAYSQARSLRRGFDEIDLGNDNDVTVEMLVDVDKKLQEWKHRHGKHEYFDTLDFAIDTGFVPDVDVLLVDEAQDLTGQMHTLLLNWKQEIPCIILAGDYLQTIYPFYGASPEYMLNWDAPEITLPVSRRLHSEHWRLATSVIKGCTDYPIPEIQTRGTGGNIDVICSDAAPIATKKHLHEGAIFHMARTNSLCRRVAERLASEGVVFGGKSGIGWNETEMYAYNGIQKLRKNRAPNISELKAIAMLYKTSYYLLPAVTRNKIEEPGHKLTSKDIYSFVSPYTHMEWKKGNICFDMGSEKLDLLKMKFEGANRYGIEQVTKSSIKNVTVCTIHAGKGLEAPTQFLYNELNTVTARSINQADKLQEEALVWYVGLTRARDNLYIVDDFGNKAFPIPRVVM